MARRECVGTSRGEIDAMTTPNRTAVKLLRGHPKSDASENWPVTVMRIGSDSHRFCYMPREIVRQLAEGEIDYCWAEDNGASYDFIDWMTPEEVEAVHASDAQGCPF